MIISWLITCLHSNNFNESSDKQTHTSQVIWWIIVSSEYICARDTYTVVVVVVVVAVAVAFYEASWTWSYFFVLCCLLSPCQWKVTGHFRGTWRPRLRQASQSAEEKKKFLQQSQCCFYVYCLTQVSRLFYCLLNLPLAFFFVWVCVPHTGWTHRTRTQDPVQFPFY